MTDPHRHDRDAPAPDHMWMFVRSRLRVAAVPLVPEIALHTAHPGSGLGRALEAAGRSTDTPPYWAYPWAGGMALARYLLDNPATVAGRSVLDLGAGSGLVAIAAMKAGAASALAAETDTNGHAAIRLNAALNGVTLIVADDDLLGGPAPRVDLVLAGDLHYEAALAARASAFFGRCGEAGIGVLIGDPGRAFLPRERLRLLAEYDVADFGTAGAAPAARAGVFTPA